MRLVATAKYRAEGRKECSRMEKEVVRMYRYMKHARPSEEERNNRNEKI
jgi:hypothetical protein